MSAEAVPSASSSPVPAAPAKPAVSAGKGVAFIGMAKLYFLLAGSAIEFVLPRLLGAHLYGAYRWVNSAVSLINSVVVSGTIQSVSRQTTADAGQVQVAKATGLRMHLFVGLPLALLFALAAPLVAWLAKDQAVMVPLMVGALIIGGNSFYAVLVGSANGTGQFHKQAGLDMLFATLRTVAILGAAWLTTSVLVVYVGWVAGVGVILTVAWLWVGGPGGARAGAVRPMLAFMGAMVAYQVLFNALTQMDTLLLKPLATTHWLESGHSAAEAAQMANAQVGFYGNAQLVARLPWQLMLAVTFVIFPLMSAATFGHDRDKARAYVRTTMRYSLVFAGLMGATLAASGGAIVSLVAPTHPGGWAVVVLTLGHVAFAIFSIGGTILNAAGRPRDAILGAAVTLVVLVGALWLVVPRLDPGPPLLLGTAACTASAMLLGTLVTGAQLWRQFGEFVPLATFVRVGLATAAAILVVRVAPLPATGLVAVLGSAALAGTVYLVVAVATLELRKAELAQLLRRRRS